MGKLDEILEAGLRSFVRHKGETVIEWAGGVTASGLFHETDDRLELEEGGFVDGAAATLICPGKLDVAVGQVGTIDGRRWRVANVRRGERVTTLDLVDADGRD